MPAQNYPVCWRKFGKQLIGSERINSTYNTLNQQLKEALVPM
jgi:hypothetical protein